MSYKTFKSLMDQYLTSVHGQSFDETMAWGAERYLYSRQLQDANKRIHELEQELLKLREQLKAQTSGQTVSVPLSAWNKLCAEAAKAQPLAEEKPEAFPARALRFSA